jgi:hypothetical protein
MKTVAAKQGEKETGAETGIQKHRGFEPGRACKQGRHVVRYGLG